MTAPAPDAAPRPFRRRVLYLPGYDPFPPRRYRELYRREGAEQARISGFTLEQAKRSDPTGFGWAVEAEIDGAPCHSEFEVLVWADLVQGSMGRSILATYGQLARTAWAYIGSGALWRLMRLRRAPVIAALYPIVVLLLQALSAVLVGMVGFVAIRALLGGASGLMLGLPVALGLGWAVLAAWRRMDGRIFAYYLMHDYAFTARLGGAYPPELHARIREFAARIAQVTHEDWDEVLLVGHSSGAYLGASVLAELTRQRSAGPAPLGFLSLGHVVPMASFLPEARALRRDLHDLAAQERIFWLDVSAPGDACCFGLCDPVAVSGVAPERGGPLVISAAFQQTLSPAQLKALRHRWFRLHFQYLCAFDQPRDYDYFTLTAGAQTLAERFKGRAPSPGRIARPVNRYTDMDLP